MTERQVTIVVGAGRGLGNALIRRFAEAGMSVAAVSCKGSGPEAAEYQCWNVGSRRHSRHLRQALRSGMARRLLWRISGRPGSSRVDVATWPRHYDFYRCHRVYRDGAGFAAFAVLKFALRALAQSMARELGPKGLHLANVIIDGTIDEDVEAGSRHGLAPTAIAEAYYQLRCQQHNAWTHEFDLRPAGEKFRFVFLANLQHVGIDKHGCSKRRSEQYRPSMAPGYAYFYLGHQLACHQGRGHDHPADLVWLFSLHHCGLLPLCSPSFAA